jgi:hypothetical protein
MEISAHVDVRPKGVCLNLPLVPFPERFNPRNVIAVFFSYASAGLLLMI